jgi:hypothetical protein
MEWWLMKNRRGQMRILEAVLACTLLLAGHYMISHSRFSTHSSRNLDLENLGLNILNTLEDQELILSREGNSDSWETSLKELIEALIPPDIIYRVSIESLVTGESIAENVTNNPEGVDSTKSSATVQGLYTFSYPLIKTDDVLLDIILIIDRSGSMDDSITGDPNNKIYYAKLAAKNFVDKLNTTTDEVGLVSFSSTSNNNSFLTYDHELVKQSIDSLTPSGYTNIGAGLYDANQQLDSLGRFNASWVIILLSDGKTNYYQGGYDPVQSREYAINQSDRSKNLGIMVYTIGLGDKDDIDEDLLIQIKTEEYYYAPSASQLDHIYQAIAEDLIYEVKYDIIQIQITLWK